jgi:hypothetical protein
MIRKLSSSISLVINYLEIRENIVLLRVELVIKDQHLQITLDCENKDLFVNVLGFATTQTLHSPAGEFNTSIETDYTQVIYRDGGGLLDVEWQRLVPKLLLRRKASAFSIRARKDLACRRFLGRGLRVEV